jgi:hypothetical protein
MTSKPTAYLHPKFESLILIRLDSFNEIKIVNHETLKKSFALALHTGQVSGGSFSQV